VSTCSNYVYQSALILANIMDRCIESFGDFRGKEKKAKKTTKAKK
jgi:hypothetical protein